jgi:hypothetical protein
LNRKSLSLSEESSSAAVDGGGKLGLRPWTAAAAAGEEMAPARSWEKERQSESGSLSAKKLDTRVIGPGLAPGPTPEKRFSIELREGRVIVGRRRGADDDDDENDDPSSFLAIIFRVLSTFFEVYFFNSRIVSLSLSLTHLSVIYTLFFWFSIILQ